MVSWYSASKKGFDRRQKLKSSRDTTWMSWTPFWSLGSKHGGRPWSAQGRSLLMTNSSCNVFAIPGGEGAVREEFPLKLRPKMRKKPTRPNGRGRQYNLKFIFMIVILYGLVFFQITSVHTCCAQNQNWRIIVQSRVDVNTDLPQM